MNAPSAPPALRPLFVLAAYAALVAVPLLLLYFRAARPAVAASAPPPGALRDAVREPAAFEVPPFDAHSAADAPPFPDLELRGIDDGAPVALSATLTGPAIVHVWSLACESCADEWHSFERLAHESVALGLPPIVSVLVVPEADSDPAAAARALLGGARRDGWFGRSVPTVTAPWVVVEERVLADGDRPTAERPITGYPETFLLDGRRRIRLRLVGPMPWDVDVWRGLLESVPDLFEDASGSSTVPDAAREAVTACCGRHRERLIGGWGVG